MHYRPTMLLISMALLLSACSGSTQETDSFANADISTSAIGSQEASSSSLTESSAYEADKVTDKQEGQPTDRSNSIDYTVFLGSNFAAIRQVFGDDYKLGEDQMSVTYKTPDGNGTVQFLSLTNLPLRLNYLGARDCWVDTIVISGEMAVIPPGLSTSTPKEKTISWCSSNHITYEDGDSYVSFTIGEASFFFDWASVNGTAEVTVTRTSNSSDSTDWSATDWDGYTDWSVTDEDITDYPNTVPQPSTGWTPAVSNLPKTAYYMFGKSVGRYTLESDGFYHYAGACWGWYNNAVRNGHAYQELSLPAKAGTGVFFLPEKVDPTKGYIQCAPECVNGAWPSYFSNDG